jgi:sorbitol-specific phosphotransferase system component IIC
MYSEHRMEYAVAALMLILLQGIVLELLTKVLVGLFGRRARRSR